jgi:hypothetical protein
MVVEEYNVPVKPFHVDILTIYVVLEGLSTGTDAPQFTVILLVVTVPNESPAGTAHQVTVEPATVAEVITLFQFIASTQE